MRGITNDVVKRESKQPRKNVITRRRKHEKHSVGRSQRPHPTVDRIARAEEQRSDIGHEIPVKSI